MKAAVCSANRNIQCDLYKNEIEKLQKELIIYIAELLERKSCVKKIFYLKPVNFYMSV